MGGLLWGLEPLLSKLLRRSCDGDACTVILCWKSEAEEEEEEDIGYQKKASDDLNSNHSGIGV